MKLDARTDLAASFYSTKRTALFIKSSLIDDALEMFWRKVKLIDHIKFAVSDIPLND